MVRRVVVFLIVVAALLVAADRLAAWAAGQTVADRLARAYRLDQQPDVQARGIPFLTQWSSGRYEEVDVRIPTVTNGGVSVTDLSVQLHAVSATPYATSSADLAGATIAEVDAQGVVPFSEVPLPPGFQLTARGNQLQVSGSVSVAGVSVPVSAVVGVSVRDGALHLETDQVTVPSAFARLGVTALVNQRLSASAKALQLPLEARLDAVSVTPSGLRISASASQVKMPS